MFIILDNHIPMKNKTKQFQCSKLIKYSTHPLTKIHLNYFSCIHYNLRIFTECMYVCILYSTYRVANLIFTSNQHRFCKFWEN